MSSKTQISFRKQRYQLPFPLRVWIRKVSRELASSGRRLLSVEETVTENISSTGCYFSLSDAPEIGSKVEMEIAMQSARDLPATGRVLCRGKVVRVETDGGKAGVACTIDHYRLVPQWEPARR
ncbi:MAG TPA: PilZ domain-containing protein [Terriglobia bacterium]|jgi:hypothetical protein